MAIRKPTKKAIRKIDPQYRLLDREIGKSLKTIMKATAKSINTHSKRIAKKADASVHNVARELAFNVSSELIRKYKLD